MIMIKNMIAEVVQERIRICDETQDNWDYGIEQCWKKYVDILSKDINKTIKYVLTECSNEEFFLISEACEELAEKTQSIELIKAFRERLAKVLPEEYKQKEFQSKHMQKWVDYAEYVRDVSQDIEYAEAKIVGS
jgi:hypothetical protein